MCVFYKNYAICVKIFAAVTILFVFLCNMMGGGRVKGVVDGGTQRTTGPGTIVFVLYCDCFSVSRD